MAYSVSFVCDFLSLAIIIINRYDFVDAVSIVKIGNELFNIFFLLLLKSFWSEMLLLSQ